MRCFLFMHLGACEDAAHASKDGAQAFLVARRFYRHVPLEAGAKVSVAPHVDERGYECLAAFNTDEGAAHAAACVARGYVLILQLKHTAGLSPATPGMWPQLHNFELRECTTLPLLPP